MALPTARVVCCVEHEASAAELLATRMEEGWLDNAPVWTDLRTFDGKPWRGIVQGIIAGIPCQPHSVAGKRLGEFDPRDLWPETAGIIRDVGPDWVFLENVPGILRYYHARIRPELHALGYRTAEGLFTAAEVGAPHRRERLFILAHRDGPDGWQAGEQLARQLASTPSSGDVAHTEHPFGRAEQQVHGDTHRGQGSRRCGEPLADTACERPCECGESEKRFGELDAGEAGRAVGNSDLTRLEGRDEPERERADERTAWTTGCPFPPGPGDTAAWQRVLAERPGLAPAVESGVRGVADGLAGGVDLPRAARLRLTGNGVLPQCAAYAFRTLWGQLADTGHTEREGRDG